MYSVNLFFRLFIVLVCYCYNGCVVYVNVLFIDICYFKLIFGKFFKFSYVCGRVLFINDFLLYVIFFDYDVFFFFNVCNFVF